MPPSDSSSSCSVAAVELPADRVEALRREPAVAYVEEDVRRESRDRALVAAELARRIGDRHVADLPPPALDE